ncbi:MAG TPA: hypothetical protein VFE36_05295 [Candidatus Baltobacteraceae bacterium]|nr:hypothetical protein [Candidatus Baltobacteraceae bacterium]
MNVLSRCVLAGTLIPAFVLNSVAAAPARPISPHPLTRGMHLMYAMNLRDGSRARVYSNGIVLATKTDKKSGKSTARVIEVPVRPNDGAPLGAQMAFPSRQQIQIAYDRKPVRPYAPGRVVVVLRGGAIVADGRSTDSQLNALMSKLGASRMERLFQKIPQSALESMRAAAQSKVRQPLLDIGNAYVAQVTKLPVPEAIARLRRLPQVAYASPDWSVGTFNTGGIRVERHAAVYGRRLGEFGRMQRFGAAAPILPSNYTVQSSEQSMLNAPGVNAIVAYDEIERKLHQLPGAGVRITNVSIGDIMDASDATGPCAYYETGNGPTTVVQGSQRYLDLPSMPLIPVWTAGADGSLGQQSVCGTGDPALDEIGLDFSVMAPLPDGQQRGDATASGFSDLLGIAPGASYRLVVPRSSTPALTDIDAALFAAAQQYPRPDVITASLGIGADSYGFPGRYLGDDPLSAAVMAAIVNDGVTLCVSANDGTRTFTNAAIGPSGGAAPTNFAASPSSATNAGDDAFSTAPSEDFDSGNIVAGATTLDDIFSAQPQNPQIAPALRGRQAFPETRWNGFTIFASGFGSLVTLSAPGDNIVTLEHLIGQNAQSAGVFINGGTSASAPEIAAGAAVAIGVARATGKPFVNPLALRNFLVATGAAVPSVPQSDVAGTVGPQIDIGRAVETLLGRREQLQTQIARVAIAQRRDLAELDGVFESDTDPSNIDLQGPVSSIDNQQTGANQNALITVAPDWENIPVVAHYQLVVAGHPGAVLSTAPFARLFPAQILTAAALPLASSSNRTVTLTYRATIGMHVVADNTFSLTFGPAATSARAALAPNVAPVTQGTSIAVSYDLTHVSDVTSPTLLVSEPGRFNPVSGEIFHPSLTMPLGQLKGTVHVPVSSLQGGGVYGIGIQFGNVNGNTLYSDFAYTRIDDGSVQRPPAPLVGPTGYDATLGHYAELPYGAPYQLSWNVNGIRGAAGAVLEVSVGGPNNDNPFAYNVFNNPNGSERDDNGVDTGSVYYQSLSGLNGTATFTPAQLGLVATQYEQVRVLAVGGNGNVVGEAGDVSTVREDGIVPADGSYIPPGQWAITSNGNEGYFAGNVNLTGGLVETSIERFDQSSNAVTGSVLSNLGRQFYALPTGVLYGSDVGLYTDWLCDPTIPEVPPNPICAGIQNPSNYIVNSIAGGSIGALWNMPPNFALTTGASNPVNTEALLEGVALGGPPDITVALSNLSTNAIDKSFDVNTAMPPCGYCVWPPGAQNIAAVAESPAQNYAVLAAFNEGNPVLAVLNTASGSVVQIPAGSPGGPPSTLPGSGFPEATALDTGNNEAIVVPMFSNAASIWNVQTGTQVGSTFYLGQPPGYGPSPTFETYAAADPVHHVFLVLQNVTPDLFVGDNNAHSYLYEIDANGHTIKTIKTMALLPGTSGFPLNNMQLNPALREGYVNDVDFSQLMPFTY